MADPVTMQGVLSAGRAAAERRMTSTVTIRRAGARDPSTFGEGTMTVYSGPCRVAGASGGLNASRSETVGGTEFQIATRTLHLPASTTGLKDADVATVDVGECAGLVLRLVDVTPQDQATALRIACVEV